MEAESHVGRRRDPVRHDGVVLGGGPAVFLAHQRRWGAEKRHECSSEEAEVGGGDGELLREWGQPVRGVVVDNPIRFRRCVLEERTYVGVEQIKSNFEQLLLDMRHVHGRLCGGRQVLHRRQRNADEGDEVGQVLRHFDSSFKVSWARNE